MNRKTEQQLRQELADLWALLRAERDGHAALRKDAERYRLMRENIDYTDNGDGTGLYWHNQRGEFSFEYRDDPDGTFRPTFEDVIDAALLARKAVG